MPVYTKFSHPSAPADPIKVSRTQFYTTSLGSPKNYLRTYLRRTREHNFGVEALIRNEGTAMQNVRVEWKLRYQNGRIVKFERFFQMVYPKREFQYEGFISARDFLRLYTGQYTLELYVNGVKRFERGFCLLD